ncbi:MAG: hypothetical protein K2X93_24605 [Candidatus Obscuribacterales bacterium]|nr:hypothetical protein [Candidatus Obscuribacterales bacterium]
MTPFESIFDKVKSAAGKVADQTNRAAKLGKLKMNVVTLNSEKNKHLQAIGLRVYTLLEENSAIDGNVLKDKIKDEISQIERIDEKIKEIDSEIAELQLHTQHVDVDDVTDDHETPDSGVKQDN